MSGNDGARGPLGTVESVWRRYGVGGVMRLVIAYGLGAVFGALLITGQADHLRWLTYADYSGVGTIFGYTFGFAVILWYIVAEARGTAVEDEARAQGRRSGAETATAGVEAEMRKAWERFRSKHANLANVQLKSNAQGGYDFVE